jgi:hypothetical protein
MSNEAVAEATQVRTALRRSARFEKAAREAARDTEGTRMKIRSKDFRCGLENRSTSESGRRL